MTIVDEICQDIVQRLKKSLIDNDMVVSGKTYNSIRYEADFEKGNFKIFGASHIEAVEVGRAPNPKNDSNGEFLKALEEWARLRGVKIPARSLQFLINKKGTRLYQGIDVRFSGKKQSGVISEIINENLLNDIQNKLSLGFKQKYFSELKSIIL